MNFFLKKKYLLGVSAIMLGILFIPEPTLADTCQLKASLSSPSSKVPINQVIHLNLLIDYSQNAPGSCNNFRFKSSIRAYAWNGAPGAEGSEPVSGENFQNELSIDPAKKQLNVKIDYAPSNYAYNKVGFFVRFSGAIFNDNSDVIANLNELKIQLAEASNTPSGNAGGPTNTPPAPANKPPQVNVPDSVPVTNVPNYDGDARTPELERLINTDSVPAFLASFVKFLLLLIAGLSVIVILIGAFRMAMSQGKSEALTAGKKTITWAIIGLVVALLSYSIVAILQSVIGVQ